MTRHYSCRGRSGSHSPRVCVSYTCSRNRPAEGVRKEQRRAPCLEVESELSCRWSHRAVAERIVIDEKAAPSGVSEDSDGGKDSLPGLRESLSAALRMENHSRVCGQRAGAEDDKEHQRRNNPQRVAGTLKGRGRSEGKKERDDQPKPRHTRREA